MKRYRIHTPVPGHTEVIGTVAFAQGVAEVEAEQLAAPLMYFRAQGYTIEELDEDGRWVPEAPLPPRRKGIDAAILVQQENEALRARVAELEAAGAQGLVDLQRAGEAAASAVDVAGRPARNASTEVWRTWAVEHGGMSDDEAAALSRDQLVEQFESEEKS